MAMNQKLSAKPPAYPYKTYKLKGKNNEMIKFLIVIDDDGVQPESRKQKIKQDSTARIVYERIQERMAKCLTNTITEQKDSSLTMIPDTQSHPLLEKSLKQKKNASRKPLTRSSVSKSQKSYSQANKAITPNLLTIQTGALHRFLASKLISLKKREVTYVFDD